MFQCTVLRLALLSILLVRKRTKPLASSWIRNKSNLSGITVLQISLKNTSRERSVIKSFSHFEQYTIKNLNRNFSNLSFLWSISHGIKKNKCWFFDRCRSIHRFKSTFFNFEHFNATGSAKQSTDDFNDRKMQCGLKVQRPFHRNLLLQSR